MDRTGSAGGARRRPVEGGRIGPPRARDSPALVGRLNRTGSDPANLAIGAHGQPMTVEGTDSRARPLVDATPGGT